MVSLGLIGHLTRLTFFKTRFARYKKVKLVKCPIRPRENHNTTRLKMPELNWFFGGLWNFVQLNVEL